jgi:predicted DNA-binding transcriptional regulator YafY
MTPNAPTEMITVKEFARRLGVSLETARRIARSESSGVHVWFTPGSTKKPMIRIEAGVVDRIMRRSTLKPIA